QANLVFGILEHFTQVRHSIFTGALKERNQLRPYLHRLVLDMRHEQRQVTFRLPFQKENRLTEHALVLVLETSSAKRLGDRAEPIGVDLEDRQADVGVAFLELLQ